MKREENNPESIQDIAQFVFDNGKRVHERIDDIVHDIIVSENKSIQNLTLAQVEVIMTISRVGALSLKELAAALKVSAPSTSNMVERLVEKKILSRQRDKKDRRKILIDISENTKKRIAKIDQAILSMFVEIIKIAGVETGQMWCTVLKSITSALDKMDQKN